MRESIPIKEIANQQETYKKLPDEISAYPMRLKQSSEVKIEKKVTAFLKVLRKASEDLVKKLEMVDLYESLMVIQQKIEGFYSKLGTIDKYQEFEKEYIAFAKFVDNGLGNNESMALLIGELEAIDQLQ